MTYKRVDVTIKIKCLTPPQIATLYNFLNTYYKWETIKIEK